MKISKLNIKNFLGIEEFALDAAKINIFKGPMGSGKSSIIEGIEKGFTNKDRRTEVVRHGKDEATLLIELDNGLEVDRRIRTEKADYLKLRKENDSVPNTEKFLRSLVAGDIFRPIDWINQGIKKQTESILNMLQISWSMEDIINWFGEETCNIDYTRHILQILSAIETKYYKDREEVNRAIRELKTQIKVIFDELPAEYDGEFWRDKKIQEYYNKVSEAQKVNGFIAEAKRLQEGLEEKIKAIETTSENEKNKIKLKFKDQSQDIKDIMDLAKHKIEKSQDELNGLDTVYQQGLKTIDIDNKEAKNDLEIELQAKIQELKAGYAERIVLVDKKSNDDKQKLKLESDSTKETLKDTIEIQNNKIAAKEQELLSLDALEEQEIKNVDDKKESEIDKVKSKVGKAAEYLEKTEEIDIVPLQTEADKVADMQSYLRQWDSMIDIRDNKLSEKERYSKTLTARIDKARTLPGELLKAANMPIEGISVDVSGNIRINGTLIDGLSDGEKLKLAMKIAKTQAGELKIVCLDKFESLNPKVQEELLTEIEKDTFQYFITSTMADKFEVEKRG